MARLSTLSGELSKNCPLRSISGRALLSGCHSIAHRSQELCNNPRFGPSGSVELRRGLGRTTHNPGQTYKITSHRLPVSYQLTINKLAYSEVSCFGIDGKHGIIKLGFFLAAPFTARGSSHMFLQDVDNLISEALACFKSHICKSNARTGCAQRSVSRTGE